MVVPKVPEQAPEKVQEAVADHHCQEKGLVLGFYLASFRNLNFLYLYLSLLRRYCQ